MYATEKELAKWMKFLSYIPPKMSLDHDFDFQIGFQKNIRNREIIQKIQISNSHLDLLSQISIIFWCQNREKQIEINRK